MIIPRKTSKLPEVREITSEKVVVALVLHLIGQEGGGFLDQSQIAKMQKNPVLDYFPHLVVNLLLKQKVNE